MSTIKEIIARVDAIKPNAFDDAAKVNWLASLEGKIAADVFLMSFPELAQFRYTVADSMDTEPLVCFPHDDVYDLWLCAQIDLANGEYNKYQNTMVSYNESYGNFVRWFARVYEPSQRNGHPGFCLRSDLPVYYITAYGLAVKQGFTGSLDDWLASLQGKNGAAVLMRYEDDILQWQNEGDIEWKDLLYVSDLQGKITADTLAAATEAAQKAEERWSAMENMVVSSETLKPGSSATVLKRVEGNSMRLNFGIPRGEVGPQGATGPQGAQGVQGPAGPQGLAGVAIAVSGSVAFNVVDGVLRCYYTGDEAPKYSINEDGHLILEV